MKHGGQYVLTTGEPLMPAWSAGSWGIQDSVSLLPRIKIVENPQQYRPHCLHLWPRK